MDTTTAQILVFGGIVIALGAFANFMSIRQKEREGHDKDLKPPVAPTSL